MDAWQRQYQEWQAYAERIRAMAARIDKLRSDRGWALAASVGIPRDMCCLHNASIDDSLTGWCAGNPQRLKIAKRACYILNDWRASRLADTLIYRHYPNAQSQRE